MKNQLTIEDWENKYTPNETLHSVNFEDNDGKFETFGKDLDTVKVELKKSPKKVWTVVEEDGVMYIIAGFHFINRLFYVITNEECVADNEEYSF